MGTIHIRYTYEYRLAYRCTSLSTGTGTGTGTVFSISISIGIFAVCWIYIFYTRGWVPVRNYTSNSGAGYVQPTRRARRTTRELAAFAARPRIRGDLGRDADDGRAPGLVYRMDDANRAASRARRTFPRLGDRSGKHGTRSRSRKS